MSDYTYQDMMRMQSEAKQRVLEMQKRSRSAAENFNGRHNNVESQKEDDLPRVPKAISYPADLKSSQQHTMTGNRNNNKAQGSFLNLRGAFHSVFGNLNDDDYEKMMIMSLCLLLSSENKDDSLVFALMYLLM